MDDKSRKSLFEQVAAAQKVMQSAAFAVTTERLGLFALQDRTKAMIDAARKSVAFIDNSAIKNIQTAANARLFLPPTQIGMQLMTLQSNQWAEIAKKWSETSRNILAPLQPMFKKLSEQQAKAELVEQSGWLPHTTTPFHLIEEGKTAEEVDEIVSTFYKDEWADVEATFLRHIDNHNVDEEAKACFREAIKAHKLGLYRTVPRTLFPEIERVASVEFYDGRHKATNRAGKLVNITSLPTIRDDISNLPAGEVLNYDYGYHLFKKMEAHLYERVGEEPDEIAKFEADPVPNRHASLHGIVSYTSAKSSLNVLIMTDFLFHMMSRVKEYIEEIEEEDGDQALADQ